MTISLEGRVILQVLPALDTGGVEQMTLDTTGALVRAGARALVASAGGRLEPELERAGGEPIHLPLASRNPLTIAANVARIAHVIRSRRVDLVQVRSRAPAFSALPAAALCGVPTVTTYHGVYNARSPLKRWYNKVMTRGDLTIVSSEFTAAHIRIEHGLDPARVLVIPEGIDLARFDPAVVAPERTAAMRASWGVGEGETRPVFLLAGRLTRWKGQALAIEALRRCAGTGAGSILVLAGSDQGRSGYLAELHAQVEAAGLGETVRFAGHVADMPAAYLAADVVLAPSTDPEAFGRTAVEPQAMGRPVLAADHGAVRETVDEGVTGWRVAPGDAEAWAGALLRMMAMTGEARAAMGAAGLARARQIYTLERMTDATLAAYARVIADHKT